MRTRRRTRPRPLTPPGRSSRSSAALMPDVSRPRERGFVPWQPKDDALKLVDQVQAILHEYRRAPAAHHPSDPLSFDGKVRPRKDDRATFCTICRRARRARIIDMEAIRDDGGIQEEPESWEDADEYIRAVQRWSQDCLSRSAGRPAETSRRLLRSRRHGAAARSRSERVWRAGPVVGRLRLPDREAHVRSRS